MRFDAKALPQQPRRGTDAHRSAVERLQGAQDTRADRRQDYHSARDTLTKTRAAIDLRAADDQVAAREAWVAWIERGY